MSLVADVGCSQSDAPRSSPQEVSAAPRLLALLHDLAGEHPERGVTATVHELGMKLGVSDRTVQRAVRDLEITGFLAVRMAPRRDAANTYQLVR